MTDRIAELDRRLSDINATTIGFRCTFCSRAASGPVDSYVARFGPDASLVTLLRWFMQPCEWSPFSPFRKPRKYDRRCGAQIVLGSRLAAALPPRRFPPPWRVKDRVGGLVVVDANDVPVAYVECTDKPPVHSAGNMWILTADEGRRIALWISRLPQLIRNSAHPASDKGDRDGPKA